MVKQPTGTNPRRYPPCKVCGFKDWPTATWGDQYTYPTDGLCKNCYQLMLRRRAGVRPQAEAYPDHPARVVGVVTLARQSGIKAEEVAARCHEAKVRLFLEESRAEHRGLAWREAHPEQFTPEAIAAIYRDPAGLAVSAWADDLATASAA